MEALSATGVIMAKHRNKFAAGSGQYQCKSCQRETRSTGRGDNELMKWCEQCFDLAMMANQLSDGSNLTQSQIAEASSMISFLRKTKAQPHIVDQFEWLVSSRVNTLATHLEVRYNERMQQGS